MRKHLTAVESRLGNADGSDKLRSCWSENKPSKPVDAETRIVESRLHFAEHNLDRLQLVVNDEDALDAEDAGHDIQEQFEIAYNNCNRDEQQDFD